MAIIVMTFIKMTLSTVSTNIMTFTIMTLGIMRFRGNSAEQYKWLRLMSHNCYAEFRNLSNSYSLVYLADGMGGDRTRRDDISCEVEKKIHNDFLLTWTNTLALYYGISNGRNKFYDIGPMFKMFIKSTADVSISYESAK